MDTFDCFCGRFWCFGGMDVSADHPEPRNAHPEYEPHLPVVVACFEHIVASFAGYDDQRRSRMRFVVALPPGPDFFSVPADSGIADEHRRIYQRMGPGGIGQRSDLDRVARPGVGVGSTFAAEAYNFAFKQTTVR